MSKAVALMRVENVLTRVDLTGPPMFQGRTLLLGLRSTGLDVFFVTDFDGERAADWLEESRLVIGARVFPEALVEDPVQHARSLGWDVQFYVDNQPERVAYAIDKGVTALLFAAPGYIRPEFRPDFRGPVKPWDVLMSRLSEEGETLDGDERLVDGFTTAEFGD